LQEVGTAEQQKAVGRKHYPEFFTGFFAHNHYRNDKETQTMED